MIHSITNGWKSTFPLPKLTNKPFEAWRFAFFSSFSSSRALRFQRQTSNEMEPAWLTMLRPRKNVTLSRNSSMGFAKNWKTKKIFVKEWSKKHTFFSHFFIFHHKPKRMLKFTQNGFRIIIVQKMRKKGLSRLVKMHFSVSGHVTLGVVRWRHELIHFSSLWLLSKFGPVEAHICRVVANWFSPSNGIKRYFNGPLRE